MSESIALLPQTWKELQTDVDSALTRYLCLDEDCPAGLREAMSYSVNAGGKRLRPILVLLACEACGGTAEAAMPAACAIEMVHTYSLIHDDLPAMDDDELRRGRPTNHVMFGEAMAILAGDALLTTAFQVMASRVQPAKVAAECCADLAAAAGASGMVGGQVADLDAERRLPETANNGQDHDAQRSVALLQSIHRRKTGTLLTCALTLGARIARADTQTLQLLDHYGRCVGLAFQITDDLLDVLGDATKLGKEVGKDTEHGKLTYPALLGIEQSRAQAAALVDEACRTLAPLVERGRRLEALAHFVLERDF